MVVYRGIILAKKKVEESQGDFAFRVKMGEYEVEIRGKHEEVIKTIEKLPKVVKSVQEAFESLKPKTIATLTVKREEPKTTEKKTQKYPLIKSSSSCKEAVLMILETDWGKWRPRTADELKGAIKANKLKYSESVLTRALSGLVKKGLVRRWNTNAGFVYILAEEKGSNYKGKNK